MTPNIDPAFLRKEVDRLRGAEGVWAVPESMWSPLPHSQLTETQRLSMSLGPEGLSFRLQCQDCHGRSGILIRPPGGSFDPTGFQVTVQGMSELEEHISRWVETHVECAGSKPPIHLPAHVHETVEFLKRRADSYLKAGRSAPPTLVATPVGGKPVLLDVRDVYRRPMGQRHLDGYKVSAAVRRLVREHNIDLASVIYYQEIYVTVVADDAELDPERSAMVESQEGAALDDQGRSEGASLMVETPKRSVGGHAPIIRRSGRADVGPGHLGKVTFTGMWASQVYEDVFVEEIQVEE